jgi:nitrogen fixation protein FixH
MKRGWIWAMIPFVVLGLSMVMHAIFLALAASDPSIAVEEDYYQKALDWDQHRAQKARNKALGWSIAVKVDNSKLNAVDRVNRTGLAARLTDRSGRPVTGAVVRLETFHHARSAHVLKATLNESEPGVYRTALLMRRSGNWELLFRVERGREVFTQEISQHMVVGRVKG